MISEPVQVAAVGAQGGGRPVGVGEVGEELLDVSVQRHRNVVVDASRLRAWPVPFPFAEVAR